MGFPPHSIPLKSKGQLVIKCGDKIFILRAQVDSLMIHLWSDTSTSITHVGVIGLKFP